MNNLLLILSLVLVFSGCASKHWVDAKGRDCRRNLVGFIDWDACDKDKEPLATIKTEQEIKIEASVD